METVLFEFIKFRPSAMRVSNVVILYPNDDTIIGNIEEQLKIINQVYKSDKQIEVISIPSYLNDPNLSPDIKNKLPQKSAHLMFKENSEIIQDIYLNIKKHL